ncbi:MAG: hypothetical protein WCL61_01420 [bacterium]
MAEKVEKEAKAGLSLNIRAMDLTNAMDEFYLAGIAGQDTGLALDKIRDFLKVAILEVDRFRMQEQKAKFYDKVIKSGAIISDLLQILAVECDMEVFDGESLMKIEQSVLDLMPPDVARRYGVVPAMIKDKILVVAIDNPTDCESLDSLRFILKRDIEGVVVDTASLEKALNHHYHDKRRRKLKPLNRRVEKDHPLYEVIQRFFSKAGEEKGLHPLSCAPKRQ